MNSPISHIKPLFILIPKKMGWEITNYSPSDQEALVGFFVCVFKELGGDFILDKKDTDLTQIPQGYQNSGGVFYLAKHHHKIVGSIGLRRFDEVTLELKRFYVLKEHRKSGLGTILLTKALTHASENCDRIYLDTTELSPALSLF